MKKLVYTLFLLWFCFTLHGAEKTRFNTLSKGVLRVGTSLNNPPFVQLLYGQRVGFEVDLVDAISKLLKLRYELIDAQGNQLVSGLDNQQFDAIMGGISMTENLQRQVNFSIPYMNVDQMAIISKIKSPGMKNLLDLKGRTVGAISGSSEDSLSPLLANSALYAKIVTYPPGKLNNAIKDLEKGQIDALIASTPVANSILKSKRTFISLGVIPNTTQPLAFGFSKKNPELLAAFNQALKKLQESGNFNKIYKKWFKEAPPPQGLPQGESPNSNR